MMVAPGSTGVMLCPSPKDFSDHAVLFKGDCAVDVNTNVLAVIELGLEMTGLLVLTQLTEVAKANKNEIIRPIIFTIVPPVDRSEIAYIIRFNTIINYVQMLLHKLT